MFQYRKRYGLHAIAEIIFVSKSVRRVSIPQAVWIACNFSLLLDMAGCLMVSIPQAVWIACNEKIKIENGDFAAFQYRKRYGLHAI